MGEWMDKRMEGWLDNWQVDGWIDLLIYSDSELSNVIFIQATGWEFFSSVQMYEYISISAKVHILVFIIPPVW